MKAPSATGTLLSCVLVDHYYHQYVFFWKVHRNLLFHDSCIVSVVVLFVLWDCDVLDRLIAFVAILFLLWDCDFFYCHPLLFKLCSHHIKIIT